MKKIKQTAILMLITMFAINFANAQCPVPTGLAATSLSATSSQLNWNNSTGATGYAIEVQDGKNNPVPFLVTANPATNSFIVNGMTAGSVYKFKVRTRCGGDKSNWSAWFIFVAGGGAVNCVPLTGLAVSNISATGATFNWNASSGGLGYSVRVEDASGNPVAFLFSTTTTANSYNMTGLNPSSNYKVKIRKRCAVGVHGPWSPWVFFTTNALRVNSQNIQASNAEAISLYPNPASDYIQINLKGNGDEKIKSFQIYDVAGKLMQSENIAANGQNNSFIISTKEIDNGIYQLNLLTTNQLISRKIVISK